MKLFLVSHNIHYVTNTWPSDCTIKVFEVVKLTSLAMLILELCERRVDLFYKLSIGSNNNTTLQCITLISLFSNINLFDLVVLFLCCCNRINPLGSIKSYTFQGPHILCHVKFQYIRLVHTLQPSLQEIPQTPCCNTLCGGLMQLKGIFKALPVLPQGQHECIWGVVFCNQTSHCTMLPAWMAPAGGCWSKSPATFLENYPGLLCAYCTLWTKITFLHEISSSFQMLYLSVLGLFILNWNNSSCQGSVALWSDGWSWFIGYCYMTADTVSVGQCSYSTTCNSPDHKP